MQLTVAQKKARLHFVIKQDDDQELLVLDVPAGSTMEDTYTLFEKGKSSLTIGYALDDDPNLTVKKTIIDSKADLIKYCKEVTDRELAGTSDLTISNKIVAPSTKNITGFQTAVITYDYSKFISGPNITEKGKAVLYVIKLEGTSTLNTETHPFLVRIKFDYQQNNGDDLSKVGDEIINTIKKGVN